MKKKLFFFLILSSFFVAACHCKKKASAAAEAPVSQSEDFSKIGYTKATVINYEVDGCHFLLQLEDGKKLEPSKLADEFKKDKLAVWIKYTLQKNAMSICMAGQMVELSDIQLRK